MTLNLSEFGKQSLALLPKASGNLIPETEVGVFDEVVYEDGRVEIAEPEIQPATDPYAVRNRMLDDYNNRLISFQNETVAVESEIHVKLGDPSAIQKALNRGALDASATNPRTVVVPEAVFDGETGLTLKPYVNIQGVGMRESVIKMALVPTGMLNIGSDMNNTKLEIHDMGFDLSYPNESIMVNDATGMDIYFYNPWFYNSSGIDNLTFVYEGPDNGANKVYFINPVFEGAYDGSAGGFINVLPSDTYNNDSCTDEIFIKNPTFINASVGLLKGAMTVDWTGGSKDTDVTGAHPITALNNDVNSGCTFNMTGVRYGEKTQTVYPARSTGGAINITACKILGNDEGFAAVSNLGGEVNVVGTHIDCGNIGIYLSGGTNNVASSKISKDVSGSGVDLHNSTGTFNLGNVWYTSGSGTLTHFPLPHNLRFAVGKGIFDLDEDTGILFEEGSDDDTARMKIAGTERFTLSATTLILKANLDMSDMARHLAVVDDSPTAFQVREGATAYMTIDTTDGSELVAIHKILDMDSNRVINLDTPTTNGDAIRQTSKITETILEDYYNYNTDFTENTGFPNLTSTELSFDDGTRTFSIDPTGADFSYFISGVQYTVSSTDSIQLTTDTEGKWYIWYDGATLTTSQTIPASYFTGGVAPVTIIYWDATNQEGIHIHRETHDISRQTHEELHYTVGCTYRTGLDISGYTLNTDSNAGITFGISAGILYDEEMEINIVDDATPDADFEQDLSDPAKLPVHYLDGAGADLRKDTATDYAIKNTGSGRVNYNQFTGGAWQQTECTDNYFVPYLINGSNIISGVLFSIQGQAEYNKLADAIEAGLDAFDLEEYSIEELKPLYLLIFRSKDTFGGDRKAKLSYVGDVRTVVVGGGQELISISHNALSDRDAIATHPASSISTDVTNFNGALSATEDDVQKALDVLDDDVAANTARGTGEGHINIFANNYSAIIQGDWVIGWEDAYFLGFNLFNSTHTNADEINYQAYLAVGTYTMVVIYYQHPNRGIVDFCFDGDEVGSVDMNGTAQKYTIYTEASIVVSAGGLKTIKVKVDGTSGADYYCGITSIHLYRTA